MLWLWGYGIKIILNIRLIIFYNDVGVLKIEKQKPN
jgi:hypothetical protein